MNNVVINPYEYFADPTKGRPIFNGSIYVGIPDTDPEVPANQKQVYARQENGTDVAIPQPVATNAGGYPTYNGSVIAIVVNGSYSIKVNDKNGVQAFYSAFIDGSNFVAQVATIAALRTLEPAFDGQQVQLLGHTVAGIGGGVFYSDYSSVAADDNGVTVVTTGGKRWIRQSDYAAKNVAWFGAAGDGADSTTEISSAKAFGKVAFLPDGSYPDSMNGEFYLYPSNAEADGAPIRYAKGETTSPVTDPRAIMMLEKTISTDRGALGNFDAGGLYVQVNKRGGDALVTGITGYVRSIDGPSDTIGIHGRVALNKANNDDLTGSEGFGGWSYCDINPSGGGLVTEGIGHEIDIRNRGADIPFNNTPLPPGSTQGDYRGLVIVTADNSAGYCAHALDIGAQSGSKAWYTGIRLRLDGIAPSADVGENTCALRIQGSLTSPNNYGGTSFDAGYLVYGTNYASGAVFENNNAIVLNTNQRILFDNNFRHLSWNGSHYNFNQGGIAINGTRVINTQQAAISNAAGGDEITKINAILAAMRAHGLIAT